MHSAKGVGVLLANWALSCPNDLEELSWVCAVHQAAVSQRCFCSRRFHTMVSGDECPNPALQLPSVLRCSPLGQARQPRCSLAAQASACCATPRCCVPGSDRLLWNCNAPKNPPHADGARRTFRRGERPAFSTAGASCTRFPPHCASKRPVACPLRYLNSAEEEQLDQETPTVGASSSSRTL